MRFIAFRLVIPYNNLYIFVFAFVRRLASRPQEMNRMALSLFDSSRDSLLFLHQFTGKPHQAFLISDNTEAVVFRNGELSSPYRSGDQIPPVILKALHANKAGQQGGIYICRKQQVYTLKWGCGDIATPFGQTLGANGEMQVAITNSRLLVKRFALSLPAFSPEGFQKGMDTALTSWIRKGLTAKANILETDEMSRLDEVLFTSLEHQLQLPLMDAGLGLLHLHIEDVLVF